jgi:hypothetical protein
MLLSHDQQKLVDPTSRGCQFEYILPPRSRYRDIQRSVLTQPSLRFTFSDNAQQRKMLVSFLAVTDGVYLEHITSILIE